MPQESGHPPRSFNLATGVSETLKVNPARRLLNIMMTGKHGGAKKVGNVINLHFEGNWMPIQVTSLRPHNWMVSTAYDPTLENALNIVYEIDTHGLQP